MVENLPVDSRFIIGIGEKDVINCNGITFYLKKNCYGMHSSAHAYQHDKSVEYALELSTGSKCALKLDFIKDEVSYVIDDLNRGVAFKDVGLRDIEYHILV